MSCLATIPAWIHLPFGDPGWAIVAGYLFTALAAFLILSGLDDLAIDLAWLVLRWRRGPRLGRPVPDAAQLASARQKRVAIFVPAWHESAVIGQMLDNNLGAIDYDHFAFFVGVYPNDPDSIAAVRAVSLRSRNVHACVLPHDGPSSKADCLNWIYQSMCQLEAEQAEPFDLVLIHDAEDIIHPASLQWAAWYVSRGFDYVQVPVLALHTPIWEFTHGVYCDEFAELHGRDLPVRNALGGFVPSAGVGTCYRRELLDRLAAENNNRLFEPGCLTEDYENGLRVSEIGGRQVFVPIERSPRDATFVATREYFPRDRRSAIRQRTRWVTGISLQTWQRRGWRVEARNLYWLWRDRKNLLCGPIGLITNALLVLVVLGLLTGRTLLPPLDPRIANATISLMVLRAGMRLVFVARVYGWRFASLAPLRIVLANWINGQAALRAMWRFLVSSVKGTPLVWVKTAHQYPSQAALAGSRRRLGEILVSSFGLPRAVLEDALKSKPEGVRVGDHLIRLGHVPEEVVYQALGLQRQMPLVDVLRESVSPKASRALPVKMIREWHVLPFQIEQGQLQICGPEPPTDEITAELRDFTKLEIRFHLITPGRFKQLSSEIVESPLIGQP